LSDRYNLNLIPKDSRNSPVIVDSPKIHGYREILTIGLSPATRQVAAANWGNRERGSECSPKVDWDGPQRVNASSSFLDLDWFVRHARSGGICSTCRKMLIGSIAISVAKPWRNVRRHGEHINFESSTRYTIS
jgi:hypothetical protein